MDTLDPITLAGAAVAVAVVLSGLLFLLFSTREESFESCQAAQRVEQEALLLSKQSSGKVQKQKKKSGKVKKKAVEHDSEGELTGYEKEEIAFDNTQVEDVHEQEQKQSKGSKNTAKVEKPKSVVKEKEGKKRGKKALHKDGVDLSEARHENYDEQSRKEEDEIVIEEVIEQQLQTVQSQAPEAIMPETEPQVSNEPPQTVKKAKSKSKGSKEKLPHVVSEDVNVKRMVESLRNANLNAHEVQDLIDVLLDKQGESSQWRKSAAKGDTAEVLRKQLLEKEGMIAEERLLAQSATNKLKEVRDELQQERQKLKHQNVHATTKIQSQAKEIQALQARMQNTHETQSRENQKLQARLHQFEQMVESSSVPNIQQLQQENAQLKNSQMRAAQLITDKDALTSELAKVQQANRQVANELKNTLDMLKQKDAHLKTMEDKLRQHQNNKDAEMVVSKRLGEVSEELKKSEARNSILSADLEKAKAAFKSEEVKTGRLQVEVKKHMSAVTSHESTMKRLTDQLTEASEKVEKMERQLSEIQQEQQEWDKKLMEKEAEIKESNKEQKDAAVAVKSEPAMNHTQSNEEQKKQFADLEIHQNLLKEKDDIITKLSEDITKKDEELTNLKNYAEQLKTKNNELRQKNWKAMEALAAAEQNAQSVVSKALQAAEEQSNAASTKNDESNKEKDELMAKLKVDLNQKAEEIKSLEQVVAQQKQKNNELREKNWKAMDAVSEAERSAKTQIGKAVQAAKNQGKNDVDAEIAKTKEILCKAHDGINISDSLPYEQWLMQFSTKLLELRSADSNQGESLEQKLEEAEESYKQLTEECNHYRNGLETTEAMLKTLENNIESEIREWQSKVKEREEEMRQVREKNESLEEQLLKNKSGENLTSAKISSLEDKLQQAKAAEEEAKEKAAAFYEELSAASNKPDQEALQRIANLEKELAKVKTLEDSLTEKMAKLESKEKEMTTVKKQLEAEKSQSSEQVKRINVLNEELEKYKSSQTELQKKISSLEDAVTKANNLTQSAESLDSVNNSPEKKKKGLKGAFNKVMGSSKKDKDKDKNSEKDKTAQLEEFQKQIAAYKAQVEELKDSKTTLEKKTQTLEDEKNDLQKRLTTSLDADNSPPSKSRHIEKAVAEAIADTTNSPIKSRLSLAKHSPGVSTMQCQC